MSCVVHLIIITFGSHSTSELTIGGELRSLVSFNTRNPSLLEKCHALLLERSLSNVKCVDCVLLGATVWRGTCAFILERSPLNVTCVDHAFLLIAIWNAVDSLILEINPTNVTCVNYAFHIIAIWNVIGYTYRRETLKCDMCGLSTYLNSNLTYHQRTHTGEMLSNITCVDCTSLTIVIWNVTSTLILEENPLRVTRVKYAFLTSISSLKRHLHAHCSLSYISSPYHCFVQMCPVLHMSHFSVFYGDVLCPT